MIEQWFWHMLVWACVLWYTTITVYVAFKGGYDIKHMLARLAEQQDKDPEG
jgi:hypothetical protein